MRLINTTTYEFKEFFDLPSYAILSHTWEQDEVLYSDMANLEKAKKKPGFYKIRKTCKTAAAAGLDWAWVDTCCIDKSSSSELTEAINSMFTWYQQANICYAYISDLLPNEPLQDGLRKCRWLTRGWTLQELIAPHALTFFDRRWHDRGKKEDLLEMLSLTTGIDMEILQDSYSLYKVPVGRRMSWAAGRTTTRIEDMAYCLLGIFDVNMPMLYGEGRKSFTRLQHEIIRSTNDLSLFAWISPPTEENLVSKSGGILANTPSNFANCRNLTWLSEPRFSGEFSMTNNGLRISNLLKLLPSSMPRSNCYVLPLNCAMDEEPGKEKICLGIYLYQYGPSLYCRMHSDELCHLPEMTSVKTSSKIGYVRFISINSLKTLHALRGPSVLLCSEINKTTDAYSIPRTVIGVPVRDSITTPQVAEPLYLMGGTHAYPIIDKYYSIWFRFRASRDLSLVSTSTRADPASFFDYANLVFLPPGAANFWGRLKLPDLEGKLSQEDVYVVCGLSHDLKLWCAVRNGWHDPDGLPNIGHNRIEDISYAEITDMMGRLGYPKSVSVDYRARDGTWERFDIVVSIFSNGAVMTYDDGVAECWIDVSWEERHIDNI